MSTKTYRRTQPFAAYLLLLGASIGCYFLYISVVVPLLSVPTVVRKSQKIVDDQYHLTGEDTHHHKWFSQDNWELQPCSVLLTPQGKILFEDIKKVDETTFRVFPFSIVLDRDQNDADETKLSNSPPIVLRCETGARLKLAEPVSSIGGSSKFKLQSAQLEGPVELYRRKAAGQAEEDLRIETSNIQITNEQIITIDDVAFWFGNNQGMGRNLTIQLGHHSNANHITQDFSKINGITNIRLGHLSSLQIRPTSKPNGKKDRMLSNDSSPIEITADGPFDFDFDSNIARFQEHVQVRKLDQFGDRLNCEELVLKFNSTDSPGSIAFDSANDYEFELNSIHASGAPAILNARSQDAIVQGRVLQYDLTKQIINASDPRQVLIEKDDSQFVSKSVQYQLTDDQKLGSLNASGPGHLVRENDSGIFRASWSESLKMERISDQQHSITLNGAAKIKLDADTRLSADEIEMTVWEVPVFGRQNEFVRWAYQPDKMVASNKVHISSEKLIADAIKLVATWPNNPRAEAQIINQVGIKSRPSDSFNRNNVVTPNSQFENQLVRRVSFQQPDLDSKPIIAKGNLIDLNVDDKNGDSNIVDLTISGNVSISKPSKKHRDLSEFEIYGESLQMIPQRTFAGSELFRVHINGSSKKVAQILSEKVHLFGNKIILDQSDNGMWVDGKGQIKLNNASKLSTQPVAHSSRLENRVERVDVKFDGGMIFNGRQIYFERNVVADIAQKSHESRTTTNANGNALRITLDQSIDFKDLESDVSRSQPQIVEMIFLDSVPREQIQFRSVGYDPNANRKLLIQNQKHDLSGDVVEQMTLSSPRVVMTKAKNELVASGLGYVQIHRKNGNGNRASEFGFVGNRNSSNRRNKYTYIQTNFEQQLIVNTQSNEITMTGNLRSVFVPVSSVRQSFDPDLAGKLPEGSVRLNCQRIDIVKSDNPLSPKPASEFIATGSARIVSDTFATAANQVSYREDTDTLRVSGTKGKNVVLKYRQQNRSGWATLVGSEVTYRLDTRTAAAREVERVSAPLGKSP